jgi:hypothetical protein
MKTKMVFAALGIAALIATPALAQKQTHRARVSAPYATNAVSAPVFSNDGRLIGTDPDPRVRFELQRDSTVYSGNN